MKKTYSLFFVLISLITFSQKDYSRYYNSFRLGLNLGGAWQTADYRSCWGMGWGITLEKGFHENSTNFLSFAVRARYLGANTYGMDYKRNYNVSNNDAYNGKYDPLVNYNDSTSLSKPYVFDNYKMRLGEGSLELQVTFNRLREKTHVLLNLWGGVGITSYRTFSDLLDGNKSMYDFSSLDSTGNKTKVLNAYNGMIDKNYESYAYGSRHGNLVTFSPSAGIGLGYQFSPMFSMLWEYKITLPQGVNADLLDGKLGANNDKIAGSKDYYHYTGLNLLFTLRGKKKDKTNTTTSNEPITNTAPITNTVPVNNTAPPTNTVVSNTPNVQPVVPKPIISFVNPANNNHSTTQSNFTVESKILNVSSSNQIQLFINGIAQTSFNFNNSNHLLTYNILLNNGVNTIRIVASNNSGSDDKTTTVNYLEQKQQLPPPVINYFNPSVPAQMSSNSTCEIKAQVLNVASQNFISVSQNGISKPFQYNATNQQVTFTVSLFSGNNKFTINATNQSGADTKTTSVIYQQVNKNPPVVNLVNPSVSTSTYNVAPYAFSLNVLNVTSKSNIEVTFNGIIQSNFSFDVNTKLLQFNSTLNKGQNTLFVKATNAYGTDSKQIDVEYIFKQKLRKPPVITFVQPQNLTETTSSSNYTYTAKIDNVPNASGLIVKFNGTAITNYVYDGLNFTFITTLFQGNNTLEINGQNSDGVDTKTANVIYKQKIKPVLPEVYLINPSSPHNATDNQLYNFNLSVLNVSSKSNIEVLFNGISQSNFTYDINTHQLFFQTNLNNGLNTVVVKGTNQYGTDSKQIDVQYTPHENLKLPPIVSFVKPINSVETVYSPTYTFVATISNVLNNAGLLVKYNGNQISNYTYDGMNLTYVASLTNGINNVLKITASNSDGVDTKTATVLYRSKANTSQPPVVTIFKPVGNPTVTLTGYTFSFTATNVTKNQVEVNFNGTTITSYSVIGTHGVFSTKLTDGKNTLTVKATNNDGSDTKSENVFLQSSSNTSTGTTTNSSQSNGSSILNPSNSNSSVVICHDANGSNPQTITIPSSQLKSHLDHGDSKGACPSKSDSIKITPKNINSITPNLIEQKKDTVKIQPIKNQAEPRRPR